jgi:hypothetical protein
VSSGSFLDLPLFMGSGWLIGRWSEQIYWRNAYSDENVLVQTMLRRVTLTEEGPKFFCDASEQLYRWAFVKDVVRSKDYVRFVITPLETMHVPVRAFKDDQQAEEFVSAAKAHLES